MTGEAPSANQKEAVHKFPEVIKKIIEKGYLPEQVFNANKSTLFRWTKGGGKPQRRFIGKEDEGAPGCIQEERA